MTNRCTPNRCQPAVHPARCGSQSDLSSSTPQRVQDALSLAPGSTKLVRLWRRAAGLQQERWGTTVDVEARTGASESDRAWERLIVALEPFLRRRLKMSVRRLGLRSFEQDEVLQEVYLRLLQDGAKRMSQCGAEHDVQLLAFTARICDTAVVDLRRRARATKRGIDVTIPLSDHGPAMRLDSLQDPEQEAICRSELEEFRKALGRCASRTTRQPDRARWIMEETLLNGRRSSDLAEPLGVSSSSINSLVSRMRKNLGKEGWIVVHQPTC